MCSVLRIMPSLGRWAVLLMVVLAGIVATPACADIIDTIEINRVGDEAEIQIQFITPIQYLRELSLKNGDIRLYFNLLATDASNITQTTESRKSPPSDIVPRFTVSYPELDMAMIVSFGKLINYRVSAGKSGRSISIFVPVIKPENEPASRAGEVLAGGAAASAESLLQAGLYAYQHGNFVAALKRLIPLANSGNAAAQLVLGTMSETGQGMSPNPAEAAVRYRQAAAQGNAEAQYRLGGLYELGKGVPQDKSQASEWYRKSADQGYAAAQAKIAAAALPAQPPVTLPAAPSGVLPVPTAPVVSAPAAITPPVIDAATAAPAVQAKAAPAAAPQPPVTPPKLLQHPFARSVAESSQPPSPLPEIVAAPTVSAAAAPPVTVPPVTAPAVTAPAVAAAVAAAIQAALPAPPAPIIPPQAEPAGETALAPQRTVEEIEQEARDLLVSARMSMQNGQNEAAIATLNRLLNLPPNQQSQPAQQLIGVAREKAGDPTKAIAEFQLYLKLYPNATDAKDVAERVARMAAAGEAKGTPGKPAPKRVFAAEKLTVTGGLSQTYYKGVSHTDQYLITTNLTTSATTTATSTSDRTDQSRLISNLDMQARKRSATTDTRIAFRENYTANFLPGQLNRNSLNAAYFEQSSRDRSYLYRLGRQSGAGGGLPGRFDGASGGYSINPSWRINGAVGADYLFNYGVDASLTTVPRKNFGGVSVDLTRQPDQWNGSAYLVQENAGGGFVDRRALGTEVHYFDARQNYMGLLDYETQLREINLAMFQANWNTPAGTNFNLYADHRQSSLRLSTALQNRPDQSATLQAALSQPGVTMDTLFADAKALSTASNTLLLAVNRPFTPTLRLGGDFRISNTSGSGATSWGQAATAGSGNSYTYSLQATGNNLFFENDLGVANVSYITAPTYTAQTVAFTQVETFNQKWSVNMLLQFYMQRDNLGTHQTNITPRLHLNYRLYNSVNLEAEAGIEDSHTGSATQDDKTRRKYFFVGYRWDFR